jgi:hypothetical protein
MTNEEIYKYYKHGGKFIYEGLTAKRIYNALKENGLQVVLVRDNRGKDTVYSYIQELERFDWVFGDRYLKV